MYLETLKPSDARFSFSIQEWKFKVETPAEWYIHILIQYFSIVWRHPAEREVQNPLTDDTRSSKVGISSYLNELATKFRYINILTKFLKKIRFCPHLEFEQETGWGSHSLMFQGWRPGSGHLLLIRLRIWQYCCWFHWSHTEILVFFHQIENKSVKDTEVFYFHKFWTCRFEAIFLAVLVQGQGEDKVEWGN